MMIVREKWGVVRQFFVSSVRRDILLVLILKIALLYGLWWLCFSHPVAPRLTTQDLAKQFMGEH